jgi:hypothetical protein
MAKKKSSSAGKASKKSQHPDSKGVNPKRDGARGAGQANITPAGGHGTSSFRKNRKAGD